MHMAHHRSDDMRELASVFCLGDEPPSKGMEVHEIPPATLHSFVNANSDPIAAKSFAQRDRSFPRDPSRDLAQFGEHESRHTHSAKPGKASLLCFDFPAWSRSRQPWPNADTLVIP